MSTFQVISDENFNNAIKELIAVINLLIEENRVGEAGFYIDHDNDIYFSTKVIQKYDLMDLLYDSKEGKKIIEKYNLMEHDVYMDVINEIVDYTIFEGLVIVDILSEGENAVCYLDSEKEDIFNWLKEMNVESPYDIEIDDNSTLSSKAKHILSLYFYSLIKEM